MAGRFVDVEIQAGCAEPLALAECSVGRWAQQRHTKRSREVQFWIRELFRIAGADHQRTIWPTSFERVVTSDVVAVTVGADDGRRRQSVLIQVIENRVRL